jgi:tyrosyl-tRNA synthetase
VPEVVLPADLLRDGVVQVAAALRAVGFCASNGEGRRLLEGGGVKVDGVAVTEVAAVLPPGRYLLQSGKRKAAQVIIGA